MVLFFWILFLAINFFFFFFFFFFLEFFLCLFFFFLFCLFFLFVFAIWQRRKWPNIKYFLISLLAFIMTFAPLVLFDLKHEHILLNNFFGTFGANGGSFKKVTSFIFQERNKSYWDIFTNKLFDARGTREVTLIILVAIAFLARLPKIIKNDGVKLILLLLVSPIIGLYFYQGNYGVLYDYYMTGYYLIFILLFAIGLGQIWKFKIIGTLFVFYFFYLFLNANIPLVVSRVSDKCDAKESICFVNQKEVIDWIYKDANGQKFNVDTYVPPVIPYAYDYLLKWKTNPDLVTTNQTPLLYTVYEVDL